MPRHQAASLFPWRNRPFFLYQSSSPRGRDGGWFPTVSDRLGETVPIASLSPFQGFLFHRMGVAAVDRWAVCTGVRRSAFASQDCAAKRTHKRDGKDRKGNRILRCVEAKENDVVDERDPRKNGEKEGRRRETEALAEEGFGTDDGRKMRAMHAWERSKWRTTAGNGW